MGTNFDNPYHEERPWGSFVEFVRNEPSTVKILTVKSGQALSLQQHQHREEFWKVLSGNGIIKIGHVDLPAEIGKTYRIPANTPHRISALTDDLVILEISAGNFDENDITRLEDRYGRV